MLRHVLRTVCIVGFGLLVGPRDAGAQVLKRVDFNAGPSPYTFQAQYPEGEYTESHVPTGGWNGSGGSHLVHHANQDQYNMGWYFNGGALRRWETGDIVYVRFRIRYDNDFRWDGEGAMSNKMVDIGVGGPGRIILRQLKPHPTVTCAPDPSRYGPNNSGITVGMGIGFDCTPAAIMTYGRWHHVQFAVQTSASGNGYIKVWLDNNSQSSPTSQRLNLTIPADWNDSWTFGGFMTDYPIRTSGFVLDDFEVALSFDSNWFPGGSTDGGGGGGGGGVTPSASTGLPWNANFEGGNFSEWNAGARTSSGLAVTSSGAQAGSYAARAPLTAGTQNPDTYAEMVFGDWYNRTTRSKVEEVWLRFYSKFTNGYQWPSNGQKTAIINLTNGSDGNRRYQVYISVNPNGTYRVDHSFIDTWQFFGLQQNRGTPVAVRFDQWDKLKMYVRLNTPGQSDGIVRLWVNDVLKLEHTNVDIRQSTSYGMGKLILSGWATEYSPNNGTQWWDSWTLSATDPDGGSTPTPTTPAAPSNLRIVSE